MPAGFYLIIAAQFTSALADNALLIVAIARLQELGLPGWWAPMLKFTFTLSYVLLAPWVGPLADAVPKAVPTAPPAAAKGAVANTPVLGDAKLAKLTIVACTDLDCPACARGAKVLGELLPSYGTDVALQFRHRASEMGL